jgi:chromosome segregation ATPase
VKTAPVIDIPLDDDPPYIPTNDSQVSDNSSSISSPSLADQAVEQVSSNVENKVQHDSNENKSFISESNSAKISEPDHQKQLQELKCQNEKLQSDLDRLRKHLISVEESYTEELITAEDREKELRNRLSFCEDHISQLEKQIRDDGLVRDLKSQVEKIRVERDTALSKSSLLDDEVQKLSTTNQRLQILLEQTTIENEKKMKEMEEKHQEEMEKEANKLIELTGRLKWQETKFKESVAALGAAGRLSQQIDVKDNFIRNLRDDGESYQFYI